MLSSLSLLFQSPPVLNITEGQITLKVTVPTRSPKLSSEDPAQYLGWWRFGSSEYCK